MRRLIRAWRALDSGRRGALLTAVALLVTLFFPWYSESVVAAGSGRAGGVHVLGSATLSAWGAFSWIEALVLLISLGVAALLLRAGDGHPLRLPGGEGRAVTLAGGLACLLIVWRMFNLQGVGGHGRFVLSTGLEWGIFLALALAGVLTWAGRRIVGREHPRTDPGPSDPERVARRRDPRQRSSWRPADAPTWTTDDAAAAAGSGDRGGSGGTAEFGRVPEFGGGERRPVGWLSAPPRHGRTPPAAAQGDDGSG